MIAYFDASALVPLVILEPSTAACTDAWNSADIVVSSLITFVEVHAALAQATRSRRIDEVEHRRALDDFAVIWDDIARLPVDDAVIARAATLSATHALRGYDAVHCATALAAASDDLVAVSGDRDLLRAWLDLGVATVDAAG